MRIVITGATGNVGTALVRALRDAGGHDLTGVSRRRPPAVTPYTAARWESLDVGDPGAGDRLTEVFRGADAVVHLAWLIQPSRQPEVMRRANQDGTRHVINAVRRAAVPHLVHMSSIGTYAAASGSWKDETWSTAGISSSSYSVDKAACERLLDQAADLAISRVRPALIFQPDAASEISRYFLGRLVPLRALHTGLLRCAPIPKQLAVQIVHADDVVDAIIRIIDGHALGAFNIAAAPVVDRDLLRSIFGGIGPAVPAAALRSAADLSWRAHLQPTDAGWVDLGFSVPLMETFKARSQLGWTPKHDAATVLTDFLDALRHGRGASGPLLYPR